MVPLTLPPFKIHKRLSTSDQPTAPLRFTQSLIQRKPKNTQICQKPKIFTDISVRYSLTLTQRLAQRAPLRYTQVQAMLRQNQGLTFVCLEGWKMMTIEYEP